MRKILSHWMMFPAMVTLFLGTVPTWPQEKAATGIRNMGIPSIDFLLGKEVLNPQGTRLAHIGGVLLEGDRIAYLILNIAGQDGAWRHIPVPASIAELRESDNAVVVDLEKRILSEAPAYSAEDRPDFLDLEWERRIHSYYGERSPDRAKESYILIRR
jgi:hypothetical protein